MEARPSKAPTARRGRPRARSARAVDLIQSLSSKIVGQSAAIERVAPYVQTYNAGLAPHGRPVGIFLLLGPTGTGKTRTAEALAEVLHGTPKAVLRIDCGEYQSDHEVAKLIGAPPGYLGHRETKSALSAERLHSVTSSACDLSIVLFDEIEKAAPALTTLLLGILDKGTLRLGDGSEVDFEKSLIFLTSNLGAREMMTELRPSIGFAHASDDHPQLGAKLHGIGLAAVRRRFSPEFVNRIDAVATYQPLDPDALATILDQQVTALQEHVNLRLGERAFCIDVTEGARQYLLSAGTNSEWGARELKRVLHRELSQPLAALVTEGRARPGARILVDTGEGATGLSFQVGRGRRRPAPRRIPTVLLVDDHSGLLEWLDTVLGAAGFRTFVAASVKDAQRIVSRTKVDSALIDLALVQSDDGLGLAVDLRARRPEAQIGIMAGTALSREQEALCRGHGFPVLRKPFLAAEAIALLRARDTAAAAPPTAPPSNG